MRRDWDALGAREHDLVVVGGGIYGAAAAWDAAQRGLSVALVEREDFGAGASWNSLKTIHGGMRYLQKARPDKLRESARERRVLLGIAPALVKPLRFVVPAYGHGLKGREALAAGMVLNEILTFDRNAGLPPEQRIPPGGTVGVAEALRLLPELARKGLTGAASWHDAQAVSTERLLLAFLHAAAAAGAVLANHASAVALLRAGDRGDRTSPVRAAGVAVEDTLSGRTLEVRGRVVLNCGGPWCDDVLALSGLRRPRAPLLRARNLVLRQPPAVPFAVGCSRGGRFLFLVPWQGRTIVGTSYEPAEQPPSDPAAFLQEAVAAFPWAGLERAVVGVVHEGLVPGERDAAGISIHPRLHDHESEDGLPGLVSVQGVKYTTARSVAARAVDLVARRLRRVLPPSRTAVTPLPDAGLLRGSLEERARVAVRDEMALTLNDAVLRRLDLGTGGPPSPADEDCVARALAEEIGWDEERISSEKALLRSAYPR